MESKRFTRLVPLVLFILIAACAMTVGCGDSEEGTTTTTAVGTETTTGGTETTAKSTETSAPSGEKVVLRLPMGQPDNDPLVGPIQEMAKRFGARANGAYEIQVYTAASLISPLEALDACRAGTVEMASICYPIYAGADERLSIIELPFLFNNMDALSAAHNEELAALYDKTFSAKFNQKVLGLNHIGFTELIGTKPVKTLADWSGR